MKKTAEVGYAAVQDDSLWPFRGVLHGQAHLARRFIVEKTFPNNDQKAMWRRLHKGGWRIAKLNITEPR